MKRIMLKKTKEAAASKIIEVAKDKFVMTPQASTKTKTIIATQQQQININANRTLKSPEIYEQRRQSMKTEYTELFGALLKIKDKLVQQRVLEAINGTVSNPIVRNGACSECQQRVLKNLKRELKDVATQTEMIETPESLNKFNNFCSSLSDESRDTQPMLCKDDTSVNIMTKSDQNLPGKKKRKRKNCLPRVIKHSHAQHIQREQQQKVGKRNKGPATVGRMKDSNFNMADIEASIDYSGIKRQRLDSITSTINNNFDSDNSMSGICGLMMEPSANPVEISEDKILSTMCKEVLEAETYTDGYLPIHNAIIGNDFNRLSRQIWVWKRYKKRDLMEILTEDDEDCLQVAINNNSLGRTIEIILEAEFDVNFIYDASNSSLHLAILNEIDISSIVKIAKKIDLNLLLKTNDNGYTPLYLAVREQRYLCAEAILNVIDERLNFTPYNRSENITKLQEDEKEAKLFAKFYAQKCEKMQLETIERLKKDKPKDFKLKQSILNVNDPKSGNTMLLYSIEQGLEPFIYLLLAHLADPLIENLTGQDAKSFFGEYGRSLKLNVKIDTFLENVAALLN